MQFTKDLKLSLNFGVKNKIKDSENILFYSAVIISMVVLAIDLYLVRQFMDILNTISG